MELGFRLMCDIMCKGFTKKELDKRIKMWKRTPEYKKFKKEQKKNGVW